MASRRKPLSVAVNGAEEASFDVTGEVFIRGDIAINKTGVHMRDRAKAFMVNFEELDLGEVSFPTFNILVVFNCLYPV